MKREQSWLSRYPLLHRLFNAAVVLFCLWAAWTGTLMFLHLA
jgi:hypothetical protein